ncbi:MAG: phosphoribosylanthranilate isomerase [Planctomycetota bacterium]
MTVAIKICGVRDAATAVHAAVCGADFLGLNFVSASPRYVALETATKITDRLHPEAPGCASVGLFVDTPKAGIFNAVEAAQLDVVQLHGSETVSSVTELRRDLRVDTKLWKAVPFDPAELDAWRGVDQIDALLIDAPHVAGELTGGTGRTLDWDALRSLDRDGLPPIMLAGGLTPENVAEAIRVADPWGVDVSSGVESSRGVKDLQKIKAFCDAVHGA